MRKVTKTIELYQFEELTEEAKQKAIENLYDINVDYYWYYQEHFEEMAAEYGIIAKWPDFTFDLDRGSYFYLDVHNHGRKPEQDISRLDDAKVFLKKAGIDLRSKDARDMLDNGISLDTQHYGGGSGKMYINTDGCDISAETESKVEAAIEELSDRMLKALREEYEYRTSEEAIIDTINANEYEFTKEGELSNE